MIRLTMQGFYVPDKDNLILKRFIESAVGKELSHMSESCYYPRVSVLFKELMHKTNTTEKMLKEYSKKRYPSYEFKLLHDPYTTLLILIVQHFLVQRKDDVAARWTFNLFSIRYYSNIMWKFIKEGCNPEYWNYALETISHSHLFRIKKTISSSILYLSQEVYNKYRNDLLLDHPENIMKMIYQIRGRIFQSMRSFFSHYYKAKEHKQELEKQGKDLLSRQKHEENIRKFAIKVSQELCTYKKINEKAILEAQQITKFNKKLSHDYAVQLSDPKYTSMVEDLVVLLTRNLTDVKQVCDIKFLDHIKRLMSVKTSIKPVYFKKNLIELHDNHIIPSLNLHKWFSSLSVQTKKISRDFLAYYLGFVVRSYIC